MSNIMRSLIEDTLNELMAFLDQYRDGNDYEGVYDIYKGLALPHLLVPFRLYLMPNRDKATVTVDPSIDEFVMNFHGLIDTIVNSLNEMPRVETLLFQETGSCLKYYNMVNLNEDLVIKCKNEIERIVKINSFGPKLYYFFFKIIDF
jgi:hypothetical protein